MNDRVIIHAAKIYVLSATLGSPTGPANRMRIALDNPQVETQLMEAHQWRDPVMLRCAQFGVGGSIANILFDHGRTIFDFDVDILQTHEMEPVAQDLCSA